MTISTVSQPVHTHSNTHTITHIYTLETEVGNMEDFRSVSGVGGEDGQGFGMGKMEEEIGSVLWGQEVKV